MERLGVMDSDSEIYDAVLKDSDDRLVKELRCQEYYTVEQVQDMARTLLIRNVCLLRKATGSKLMAKKLVVDFDPSNVKFDFPAKFLEDLKGFEIGLGRSGQAVGGVREQVISVNDMMKMFMMQMTASQNREEERLRKDKEREDEKIRKDKEREDEKIKKDQELTLQIEQMRLAAEASREETRLAAEEKQRNFELLLRDKEKEVAESQERIRNENKEDQLRLKAELLEKEVQRDEDLKNQRQVELDKIEEDRKERDGKFENRLERARKIMSGILFDMLSEHQSIPVYLRRIDELFDSYKIYGCEN